MSLTIKANGDTIVNYQNLSVSRSVENVTGAFSLKTSIDENGRYPIKIKDTVEVSADDQKIFTGFAEILDGSDDEDIHDLLFSGRGKLCDFVDSTITTESLEFKNSISLVDVAKALLLNMNIDVEVIDQAGPDGSSGAIEPFQPFDVESAEIGQKGFSFLETLARKRQVLITSDEKGNLVLTRASNVLFPFSLQKRLNQPGNNIKSSNFKIDHTKLFSSYTAVGQLSPANQTAETGHKELSTQISAKALNSRIRSSRAFVFPSEYNTDGSTANNRAIWEANIRRARAKTYYATVQGHTLNGALWVPNILVDVTDETWGIIGKTFLKEVVYSQSLTEGSTTQLIFAEKDAFTLQAEQDQRESENFGSGWVS